MSNLGVAEVGKGASARSPGHLVVQADVSRVLHLLSSQWLACRVVAMKIYPGVSSEEKTNPTTTLQNSVKGPFRGRRLTIPVWGLWCSSWGRLLGLLQQSSGAKILLLSCYFYVFFIVVVVVVFESPILIPISKIFSKGKLFFWVLVERILTVG